MSRADSRILRPYEEPSTDGGLVDSHETGPAKIANGSSSRQLEDEHQNHSRNFNPNDTPERYQNGRGYERKSSDWTRDPGRGRSRSRSRRRTPPRYRRNGLDRKGSPHSRDSRNYSRSPEPQNARNGGRQRRQQETRPKLFDVDGKRKAERERQAMERELQPEPEPATPLDPAEEYKRLMDLRSGGRYVPPAKLRALQEQIIKSQSSSSKEYQRLEWDKLKKSINGLINKVNVGNIREIIQLIFQENIIRGRGVLCRSIMRAQSLSLAYTPVYASLVAVINSKLPEIGELLVKRLVIQFRRSFKRNDKTMCIASGTFLAHLVNQQVAHEILCLEIMHLLLLHPTDDSVEIAVGFVKEAGLFLSENSSTAFNGVYERLRVILRESNLEKRTQYMIETLFQIIKDQFRDNPSIPKGLDLVEEDDQNIHMVSLDDELKGEETLNVFRFDDKYDENEESYKQIKKDILGDSDEEEESEEENEAENEQSEDESENEDEVEASVSATQDVASDAGKVVVQDMTNSALISLRRTIYLTVMSTMSIDEVCHKLTRIQVPSGHEIEVVNMLVECCSQEKIYNKIYGGVGSRLCRMGRQWQDLFNRAFEHYYEIIHRYDTNKLRNIATMFGFILASDSMSWSVFQIIKMSEESSTSSSRIFVKLLFQEIQQEIGINELVKRLKEPYLQQYLVNLMPKGDDLDATRFSINYFTAIGLGAVTEDMREYLKNLPPPPPVTDSRSSSLSRSDSRSRSRSRSRSLSSRSRSRSRSYDSRSRSRSYDSRSRSRSRSRSYDSHSRSRSRSRSISLSRSPPRTRKNRSLSRSSSLSSQGRVRKRARGRSYSRSLSRSMSQSRSDSRSVSRGRALSRSISRGRSYSRSYSRSRSDSRSRSYSRSRRNSTKSYSDSRSRSRSYSRSPARGRRYSRPSSTRRTRSYSDSRSRSDRSRSISRSRSPSHSRSLSRSLSRSRSRSHTPPSLSPPPPKRKAAAKSPPQKRHQSVSPPHDSEPTAKRRAKASDYL
ncbi:Cwc22p [Sugiyamaella lignohabitans]|uniref:Pre-mRNA-splicing factor CWC22 n=1 Tax=Sugiyamaella lignohabitans TaxID=796027 RepID=A0A167CLY9_9ASCO|nr:Cwc22p [Sugiyamaella lignohabitans]ANB11870.1 Cwc22p [Sugiyamaella lignohabitans]